MNQNQNMAQMTTPTNSCPPRDRGSYRHMLDLVSSPSFPTLVNGLLEGTGSKLADPDLHHPKGRTSKKEWCEAELEEYLSTSPAFNTTISKDWWIPYKVSVNKRPTWDLICHILVNDKPGLLIVEAKAHLGELSEQDKKSSPAGTSSRSIANDLSIRLRLSEASHSLTKLQVGPFELSADHHYQLSNRLAYLHKLAKEGVPTVLMYLGWLESPDWSRDPLRDTKHWEDTVRTYAEGTVPWKFVGKKHHAKDGATMQMIVRSLNASQVAPSGVAGHG